MVPGGGAPKLVTCGYVVLHVLPTSPTKILRSRRSAGTLILLFDDFLRHPPCKSCPTSCPTGVMVI